MAHRMETLLGHLTSSRAVSASDCGSGLRYSVDDGILTAEQRLSYERDGFVVLKGLVSPEDLQIYKDRFRDICSGKVKVPGMIMMRDVAIAKSEFKPSERAVTKIQDFQFDPVMSGYCTQPSILKYVESIIGKDIMAMHTMLINKPPDPGTKSSRHPMHQDLHYFPFRPADKIVCSWTAMEHVHRGNGCLVVLPGTHKGTLLQHEYPKWEGGVNKMYHGIMDYDPSHPRVHLEMEAGDTVLFHPILIHGSGTNRTTGFRKAISTHYANSHCEYIDVTGTTQQNISNEVLELAKKRLGPDAQISFQDTWRLRGVCVQGDKVNL